MSKFSERLKSLRKQHNMTQGQLAEKIGVGRSAISMYEMGEREPDFETLEALADTFNVDMAFLLGGNKKDPTPKKESELDELLVRELMALSPDEAEKVRAFAQGLRAARPERSASNG